MYFNFNIGFKVIIYNYILYILLITYENAQLIIYSFFFLFFRQFGPKVINIKPLIKKIPGFLEDRDKTVREEGKFMVVEIYRYFNFIYFYLLLRIV